MWSQLLSEYEWRDKAKNGLECYIGTLDSVRHFVDALGFGH